MPLGRVAVLEQVDLLVTELQVFRLAEFPPVDRVVAGRDVRRRPGRYGGGYHLGVRAVQRGDELVAELAADVNDRRVESDQQLDEATGRQGPVFPDPWTAVVGAPHDLKPGPGETPRPGRRRSTGAGGDGERGQTQGVACCHRFYRLSEPRGSLFRTRWPMQAPGRDVDRVHQALVRSRVRRGWGKEPGQQLVRGDDQAGPGRVAGLVAAGEPLGEGRVAQQHRGVLVAPDATADGLAHRDEVVGHERRPVPVVVERPEPHRAPDDAEPQLPRLAAQPADGFGGLPGDRRRRAEQVPHGEFRDQGQREPQVGGWRVGTGQVDHRAEGGRGAGVEDVVAALDGHLGGHEDVGGSRSRTRPPGGAGSRLCPGRRHPGRRTWPGTGSCC